MRVVELSDHPGDMLHDVSRQRLAAGKRAQEGYEDALIQHQARVQTIRVNRDRARHQHHWWTWLRLAFAVQAERRRRPRPPPAQDAPTDAEEKIRRHRGGAAGRGGTRPGPG